MNRVTIPAAEAAQFLMDSGLLGEINRVVLHPRGLGLAVQVDDDGRAVGFSGLLDYRPSEIQFSPEMIEDIITRVAAYDAAHPIKEE